MESCAPDASVGGVAHDEDFVVFHVFMVDGREAVSTDNELFDRIESALV